MKYLARNLAVLPLLLIFRAVPLTIVYILSKIVEVGYAYQGMLTRYGIYWKI